MLGDLVYLLASYLTLNASIIKRYGLYCKMICRFCCGITHVQDVCVNLPQG